MIRRPPRSTLFPSPTLFRSVRHHSPAGALQVDRLIRERRPRAVLIEGPADADPLIPLLLDAGTVPPVALYAYRTDRKSTRLNSSHANISYAVFCLKKNKNTH